jgi:putative protein kinase ArgK-like GTPase of G3E family
VAADPHLARKIQWQEAMEIRASLLEQVGISARVVAEVVGTLPALAVETILVETVGIT